MAEFFLVIHLATKPMKMVDTVMYAYKPGIWKAEAEGSSQVQGQPG